MGKILLKAAAMVLMGLFLWAAVTGLRQEFQGTVDSILPPDGTQITWVKLRSDKDQKLSIKPLCGSNAKVHAGAHVKIHLVNVGMLGNCWLPE